VVELYLGKAELQLGARLFNEAMQGLNLSSSQRRLGSILILLVILA